MLFTIGHSNTSIEMFLGMLSEHKVDVLADVRSTPASRHLPHFNRPFLHKSLLQNNLRYVWLEELGGRPKGKNLYDSEGHANYQAMSQADFFLEGLERLKRGMETYRVAIMCSEENPNECHRRLLVVKTLCQQDNGYTDEISHIRKGGKLESEASLQAKDADAQPSLWNMEEAPWRSPKPILSIR